MVALYTAVCILCILLFGFFFFELWNKHPRTWNKVLSYTVALLIILEIGGLLSLILIVLTLNVSGGINLFAVIVFLLLALLAEYWLTKKVFNHLTRNYTNQSARALYTFNRLANIVVAVLVGYLLLIKDDLIGYYFSGEETRLFANLLFSWLLTVVVCWKLAIQNRIVEVQESQEHLRKEKETNRNSNSDEPKYNSQNKE